jgi:xylitol oxidase
MAPARLHSLFQKRPDFQRLLTSYDLQGKFRNPFLDNSIFGA